MTWLLRLSVVLGISGAVALAYGDAYRASAIWLVGNSGFVIVHLWRREGSQAAMFFIYWLITLKSVFQWAAG